MASVHHAALLCSLPLQSGGSKQNELFIAQRLHRRDARGTQRMQKIVKRGIHHHALHRIVALIKDRRWQDRMHSVWRMSWLHAASIGRLPAGTIEGGGSARATRRAQQALVFLVSQAVHGFFVYHAAVEHEDLAVGKVGVARAWVTMQIVEPDPCNSSSSCMTASPFFESRLPVGSPASRIDGWPTRARATRLRCLSSGRAISMPMLEHTSCQPRDGNTTI